MQHYAATAAMQGYAYAAVGIKSPFDKVMSGGPFFIEENLKCGSGKLELVNLFWFLQIFMVAFSLL